MSVIIKPSATLTLEGWPFAVESGRCSLDLTRSPYAQATLEVPWSDAVAEILTHDSPRAVVTAKDAGNGTQRTFDLLVTDSETVRANPRRITLTAQSDEARLHTYMPLGPDTGARAHEGSARAVVDYVLGKIDAQLQPGSADANLTAYWDATNHIENPGPRSSTFGWSGDQDGIPGGAAIALHTRPGPPGHGSIAVLEVAPVGTPSAYLQARTQTIRAQVGRTMTGAIWLWSSTARTVWAGFDWLDGDGKRIHTDSGATVNLPAGAWVRLTATATAPAGTTEAHFFARAAGSFADGHTLRVCRAVLVDGHDVVPFFDGAQPTGTDYTYQWEGDADLSPSRRIALTPRDPDLYLWEAGVSGWDFLRPLLTSAGLLLFCDERRRWWLIDPETYTAPGTVALTDARITEQASTNRRADRIDGVVCIYRWIDRDGVQRERRDAAGTAGRVIVLTYDRPYPGPTAARILARRAARGRSQTMTTAVDLSATPGMSTTGQVDTLDPIRSVEFGLTGGLMTITREGATSA